VSEQLDDALARMRAAASAIGASASDVGEEAATFVAGICADTPDAAEPWSAAFRKPVATFAGKALTGQRWRREPTPMLTRLASDKTHAEQARAYAQALVDLAAVAAAIATPSLERINAAGFAASSQLRAVASPPTPSDLAGPLQPTLPTVAQLVHPTSVAAAVGATATAEEPVKPPEPTLDELLAKLDRLIGLGAVKEEIHHQTELLRVDQLRREKGLKTAGVSRHLVFTGNPGTGKTTVARLVAGIYRALGILEKGQLVETDRSGLVAGYVGQTALKTADVVKSAIGGVLFVDEAYALAGDDFGNEAIDTLVKAMEDHREDLVLIVAGYTDEMTEFISSNPGLESRFRKTIFFTDYSDDELIAIFEQICRDADFEPTAACTDRLRLLLKAVIRDRNFGNARYIRNQFEAAVVRQAWRLRDNKTPTVDQLRELVPDDLESPTVTPPDGTAANSD
jgi:hypothetical protein